MDCLLCETVEDVVEHRVVECGGLRKIRQSCGVGGGVSLEEVLLLWEKTE